MVADSLAPLPFNNNNKAIIKHQTLSYYFNLNSYVFVIHLLAWPTKEDGRTCHLTARKLEGQLCTSLCLLNTQKLLF